jgi:hypothetical protein
MKALLLFYFLTNLAYANNKITSTVVDFEKSSITPDLFLLFLETGEVLHSKNLPESIIKDAKRNQLLTFEFDSNHKLLRAIPLLRKDDIILRDVDINDDEYIPSRLTQNELDENFKFFRKGARRVSQCFNRAHVWAFESKKNFNFNSMKVFLFFTKKFIRETNFKWWFHVAPANYLKSSNQNQLIVLDPFFTSTPLPIHEWTNLFVTKNIKCLEAQSYSEYALNQEKESCVTIKSSMYYLQPKDLRALIERSERKKNWVKGEIERAYRNGFGIWRKEFIQVEETRIGNWPN